MLTVVFNIAGETKQTVVVQNVQPGFTLLEVALNHGIDMHHDCGGICHCSTCHVLINRGADLITEEGRREKDVLKKAEHVNENFRLACQCLLQEGEGLIEVTIPAQKGF